MHWFEDLSLPWWKTLFLHRATTASKLVTVHFFSQERVEASSYHPRGLEITRYYCESQQPHFAQMRHLRSHWTRNGNLPTPTQQP
jgi:hypothetical protein